MYIKLYTLCSKTVNEFSLRGPYVGILGYVVGRVSIKSDTTQRMNNTKNKHKLIPVELSDLRALSTPPLFFNGNGTQNHAGK